MYYFAYVTSLSVIGIYFFHVYNSGTVIKFVFKMVDIRSTHHVGTNAIQMKEIIFVRVSVEVEVREPFENVEYL